MLLDWLTVKLPAEHVPDQDAMRDYRMTRPHVSRFTPSTGVVEWTIPVRDANRSDSHGVTVQVGQFIEISGSPARSTGQPNNVFGTLDIREAFAAHVEAAEMLLGFRLPREPQLWRVSRVDVTTNHDMRGPHDVRQALAYLRQSDGGRYKVRTKHETVYWSPGSRNRSGKAYAKGPHLEHQIQQGKAQATPQQRKQAHRILRLELKLGSDWWRVQRERDRFWWDITPQDFLAEHEAYFKELIGTVEVAQVDDIQHEIERHAPTKRQGAAAHRTWRMIQVMGHHHAKEVMPRATWYRHLRILQAAGLAWGDIAAGNVVPIRKTPLLIDQPLTGWQDLQAA